MGGAWPQREGILSALVPPERIGAVPRDLTGR